MDAYEIWRENITFDEIKISIKQQDFDFDIYYYEITKIFVENLATSHPAIVIHCGMSAPIKIKYNLLIWSKGDFKLFEEEFNYFIESVLED